MEYSDDGSVARYKGRLYIVAITGRLQRLQTYLCTCGSSRVCSPKWYVGTSDGCSNRICERYSGRGDIHATAGGIYTRRRESPCMLRLNRSLYMAPRCWNITFKDVNFSRSLCFNQEVHCSSIILTTCMIILTKTSEEMQHTKDIVFANQFKMENYATVSELVLNMQDERNSRICGFITQYITSMLSWYAWAIYPKLIQWQHQWTPMSYTC